MLKYTTILSICFAANAAFGNADSTLVPFDSISESAVTETFKSISDSNDYILPIINGNKGFYTKVETKLMHRDASVIVQAETMEVSDLDFTASSSGKVSNWNIDVPRTIVGSSVTSDTIYVMGSEDSRIDFQQGLLRVTKTNDGWSDPSKLKIKGFKPTSWSYGMYMHPTGDVLLIYQKTVVQDNFEIYASFKLDNETYGKPQKLESINTKGNEITPYLSMDKKRLYFSSNGFNTENDSTQTDNYDLLVCQVLNEDFSSLSAPEKLPLNVNKENSLEAYITEIDSNNIIFSSDRNGTGMRLYSARITRGFVEPIPEPEPLPEPTPEPELLTEEALSSVKVSGVSELEVVEKEIAPGSLSKSGKIIFSGDQLNFELNQAVVSQEAKAALQRHFPYTEENDTKTSEIIITGYTDSTGPDRFNKSLSKERAQAIKNILIKKGWSANKIKVLGKGSENPIADNNTKEGRVKNRRVEFEVK